MVHGEFCSAEIFCNTYIGAAPETGGGKGAEAKLSTPLSTTTAECDKFALPLWIFGGGRSKTGATNLITSKFIQPALWVCFIGASSAHEKARHGGQSRLCRPARVSRCLNVSPLPSPSSRLMTVCQSSTSSDEGNHRCHRETTT
jgi:hypothetical protein